MRDKSIKWPRDKSIKWPISAAWLMENGLMKDVAKLMAVKHGGGQWMDGGAGVSPNDDVTFTSTDLVQLEILHKTGQLVEWKEMEVEMQE